MSNEKLKTGIQEIDKALIGGFTVGHYATLISIDNKFLDDLKTFIFPKNKNSSISLSLEFNPKDMELIKKIENNPQSKLKESLNNDINRKKDILNSAFTEAVIYKLGDFKLEDLKDRALLQIHGDIQNFYIDGERLLIIEDNNNLLEPKITKLYGESK